MSKLLFLFLLVFPLFLQALEGPNLGRLMDEREIVNDQGARETIKVYQDVEVETQFYYVPNRVRLSSNARGNIKNFPDFQFIKFSQKNTNQKLLQGGFLIFSVTIALPEQMLDQLR